MVLRVKTSSTTGWGTAQKLFVKTGSSGWSSVKKMYVKFSSTVAPYWKIVFGTPGPHAEYTPDISIDYTDLSAAIPKLTGFNYHWIYNTSLTLTYNFQKGNTLNPSTNIFSSNQSYTPGNPASQSSNNIVYQTIYPDDYVANPTYFLFTITATDALGATTIPSSTVVSASIPAPYFTTTPSWYGTATPGYTITWNAGAGKILNGSTGVGYKTTIYKTNDNGITKTYIYGTSTTPDYNYSDNYGYSISLTNLDIGYTFYASTYAVAGNSTSMITGSLQSQTISGTKSITAAPGAFSITSATKGVYDGTSRPVTINWTTSQYATSYEFHIESSPDNITWYDQTTFGSAGAYPASTSKTYNIYSNSAYLRVTMRSTNDSGLYYTTSTIAISGTAPTAPVITSATSTTTNVILTFTPPTDNGSSNDLSYEVAYKTYASGTWGAFSSTSVSNNTIQFYNILTSGTSYDFKIRVKNFDLLYSPESNVYTISTKIAPGNITNVVAKSFTSGYITTFFGTGTNTTSVNLDYSWFQTQPVLGDEKNFDKSVSSSSTYSAINTTALVYPNQQYTVILTAYNQYGLSTNYGAAFYIFASGGDIPTSTTPTFSNFNSTGMTANFSTFNANKATIDLKTGGSSVSGYPKNISVSDGANSYAIPETLSGETSYTFYVTPRYEYPYDTSLYYNGVTKSATQIYYGIPQSFSISSTSKAYPVFGTPGHRQVTVTWGKSFNATRYEVHIETSNDNINWSDSGGLTFASSPYTNEPTRTYTFNAESYIYYRATVRSSNIYQGVYTYTTSVYVDGAPPGDPSIGTITVTSTSASVPYNITSSPGSNIYAGVQWSIDNSSWSAASTNPIVITGLSQGSTYTVYLRSANNDGRYSAGVNKSFTTASNLTAPTITNVTGVAANVNVYFTGGSGTYYQVTWYSTNTYNNTSYDANGSSSPINVTNIAVPGNTTWYFYVRSVSALTNTGTGPSTTISSWSSPYPWVAPQYTVTWDATTNSGTSGTSSSSAYSGSSVTAPAATRTGYTFNGWFAASSGGSAVVTSGNTYAPTSNITLYAQFTRIVVTPTITTPTYTNLTQTTATINWTSTNQASYALNGSFTDTGTTAVAVAKTGLTAATLYSGNVTVTSSTGDTASKAYSFTTSAPVTTVLYNPVLSGTYVARTSISASSGIYSNGTVTSTKIAYSTNASQYSSGFLYTSEPGANHTSPYTITDGDAAAPAYYFWAYDIISGSNGTTYYNLGLSHVSTPFVASVPGIVTSHTATSLLSSPTLSWNTTWSAPASDGGATITSYKVYVQGSTSNAGPWTNLTTSISTTSGGTYSGAYTSAAPYTTVNATTPKTIYGRVSTSTYTWVRAWVAAVNSAGTGSYDSAIG